MNSAFLGFFEAFLGVFAGIALLVAALSIHNAPAVIAAQRARESALLRAIGASGRQIFAGHRASRWPARPATVTQGCG